MSSHKKTEVKGIITAVFKYGNRIVFRVGQKRKVAIPEKFLPAENIFHYLGLAIEAKGLKNSYYGGKFKNFIQVISKDDFSIEEINISTFDKIKKIFEAIGAKSLYDKIFKSKKIEIIKNNPLWLYERKKTDFFTALSVFYILNGKIPLNLQSSLIALSWFAKEHYLETGEVFVSLEKAREIMSKVYFMQIPETPQIVFYCKKSKKIYITKNKEEILIANWEVYNLEKSLMQNFSIILQKSNSKNEGVQISHEPGPEEFADIILKNHITILTGQAGSGKTYLIKNAGNLLQKKGYKVLFTGSTGSAASSLQGITTAKAFNLFENKKNSKNYPAKEYDIIFVDEAGLLDVYTFHAIIRKLSSHQKIVFAGDPNAQLPPVQGGNFFKRLCEMAKGTSCYVELTSIKRFDESKKSLLYVFKNSSEIISAFAYAYAFYIHLAIKNNPSFPEEILQKKLPIVITPFHRNFIGTKKLNLLCKEIIMLVRKDPYFFKNPISFVKKLQYTIKRVEKKPEWQIQFAFEKGDRVMLTKNLYMDNTVISANKSTGIIVDVVTEKNEENPELQEKKRQKKEKYFYVQFENGNTARILESDLAPSYVCEFFASQGKESDYVIVLLPAGFVKKYYKTENQSEKEKIEKMFHVALTRAKKAVLFLTNEIEPENLQKIKELTQTEDVRFMSLEKVINSVIKKIFKNNKEKTKNNNNNNFHINIKEQEKTSTFLPFCKP